MKRIVLTLITIYSIALQAQDIIIKKSGEELQSKVNEITDNAIKYKRWDNQDGPLYSIAKDSVFMVKYANGSKDVFTTETKVPVQKTESVIAVKPDISKYDSLMKKYKATKSVGVALSVLGPIDAVAGAVLVGLGIATTADKGFNIAIGSCVIATGVAVSVLGAIYLSRAHKLNDAALTAKYNPTAYSIIPLLDVNPQSKSATVGMCLTF